MKFRTLGKTGLQVSVVGVGTWQFGGEWGKAFTQAEVDAIFGRAGELGINLVDTAECYGDHLSEQLVGRGDQARRDTSGSWRRSSAIASPGTWSDEQLWSPEEVHKQLHDSLRALRTDYIDLYQFHSGSNEEFDQDALWETLQRHVESGKIHHLGVSVSPNYEHAPGEPGVIDGRERDPGGLQPPRPRA